MSLKHTLLGFLNYYPMTGYELKKFFDTSVAHFWNAEQSQIYAALKHLEAEDLVEMRVEMQTDRPNRKVYSITQDGRDELLLCIASCWERV
jgi:DNA-binding PadR family transcriptional regulator